ncbi:Hha/YmoA family nucleoid-associated regulatory protein, partial [Klebsiella pneumoniae]|uniref:Hha/YmoA family nucleoid-associated regulatory protein n=1 Tax=Klebsiella pneumoniae TaxID=573 RepID=UPI003D1D900C
PSYTKSVSWQHHQGGDINKITSLNGAYDHRRAEIYMKKNYDKIPASVWHLIPDEI